MSKLTNWYEAEIEDQGLQPNTVPINSVGMAKYLMDRGFIQRSHCLFICGSMEVYKYIHDRIEEEKNGR